MSDSLDQAPPESMPPRPFKRKIVLICLLISVAIAVWVVVKTELRVSDLRARGFTDAATGSARDHAYFPLIGAYAGSLLFVMIATAFKRLLRRGK